ncbi:hypothetical protein VEE62_17280 [Escherichia coli]|nr:hypothetical protein VEE62_17280 [Escherichia coli]
MFLSNADESEKKGPGWTTIIRKEVLIKLSVCGFPSNPSNPDADGV